MKATMRNVFSHLVRPGLGLVALWLVVTAGCTKSLTDLDRQAAGLIAQRQAMVLGEHGLRDVSVTPAARQHSAGQTIYDPNPPTVNPEAGRLPVRHRDPGTDPPLDHDMQASFDWLEPLQLDLPALLAFAIEHAPEYRAEKEGFFLATLDLIIQRHEWGPRFFSTFSADLAGTPEAGDFDTALDLVSSLVVTQRLPYGGEASIEALVNYTSFVQQASLNPSPREVQDAALVASFDLPLLRGAGYVAREDIIQAERDLVFAARAFERFRRAFFFEISDTYFGLLQQQNAIRNQQLQLEGLQALADRLNAQVRRGRTPQFEADDAEAQVLFGESNLIAAQDAYQAALDSLKITIGLPTTYPLEITRSEIDIAVPALDQAVAVLTALENRLDLQNTRDQVDDAQRAALIAKNQLRGELGLSLDVSLNTDSDAARGGLGFELSDSSYAVGLTYGLPLDRVSELADYRGSLVLFEQAKRNYRVDRETVSLEVRDAIRDVDRGRLTLTIQERNIELAQRRLEGVRIRQRREPIEPRRLIEAEQDLLDARNSRDEALADLQTAVLQFLLVTGQLRVGPAGQWLAPGTMADSAPSASGQAEDTTDSPSTRQ